MKKLLVILLALLPFVSKAQQLDTACMINTYTLIIILPVNRVKERAEYVNFQSMLHAYCGIFINYHPCIISRYGAAFKYGIKVRKI